MTTEEMDRAITEIWALFKKTEEQLARTDAKIDKLTDKWGRFIESYLAPGIPAAFQARGIPINRTAQRVKGSVDGESMEIDILAVNTECVIAVEVKSTLSVDDVRYFLESLSKFKRIFPEYANKKLLGAVAGIEITGEADKFAYRQGLFVIGQAGETIQIINDEKFQPKEW